MSVEGSRLSVQVKSTSNFKLRGPAVLHMLPGFR